MVILQEWSYKQCTNVETCGAGVSTRRVVQRHERSDCEYRKKIYNWLEGDEWEYGIANDWGRRRLAKSHSRKLNIRIRCGNGNDAHVYTIYEKHGRNAKGRVNVKKLSMLKNIVVYVCVWQCLGRDFMMNKTAMSVTWFIVWTCTCRLERNKDIDTGALDFISLYSTLHITS